MRKFNIKITETLQRQIEVKVNSKEEALRLVKSKYKNEEIILDSENYVSTDFNVINELITKDKVPNRFNKDEHDR